MNIVGFLMTAAALVLPFCPPTAQAQATVRLLVGFPPGGGQDSLARVLAEKLAAPIGRPVVVENRAGAAGQIALRALKASAPDGNTLMVVPDSTMTLQPHTFKTLPYDTLSDFVPVAYIGGFDYGLIVGANVPVNDLRQWITWARADKRNATYASTSAGTTAHFLGLMLGEATGVQLVHVPYRGVGPAIAALVGGQIPAIMIPFAQMLPHVKAGRMRILAHSGSRRASTAPDVPTFTELGYPAAEMSGWYGLLAPAGMPPDVLSRYNEITIRIQRTPEMRDRMRALNIEVREMTPAEITAKIKAEYDRWGPIVRASGFTADSQ